MRVAALTVAFGESHFIAACIQQFDGVVCDHLVLVAERPLEGDEVGDDTAELAARAGAHVETGAWESQADHLNHGLSLLASYDWVLIVDADEFYTAESIRALFLAMSRSRADAITAPHMKVYWKTADWELVPDQTDNPIVAIRPSCRFRFMRQADCSKEPMAGWMYHFSYVRNDAEMLRKIRSFEHAREFDTQRWYEGTWLAWTLTSTDLHPLTPAKFKRALRRPAPAEISDRLPWA